MFFAALFEKQIKIYLITKERLSCVFKFWFFEL